MKRLFILTLLVLTAASAYAQHLTEEEAMARALRFMGSSMTADRVSSRTATAGDQGMRLESSPVEANSIYAFNINNGGFIIASADDRTLPVLGYSDSGHIDWDNLPENIRSWFKQYDEAIATLGDRTDLKDGNLLKDGNPSLTGTRTDKKPIEPLIKTHWNQFAPYYDQTPLYAGFDSTIHGKQSLTGCPATAMTQVLNFYRWPQSLPDGLPGYNSLDYADESKKWYVDSLPPVTFDYDNMLDDYHVLNPETGKKELVGTDAQQEAVATLMRYCGQAIGMAYSPYELGGSGADGLWMRDALVKYLGYPAATMLRRSSFCNIDEWEDIVYNELTSGRPVLYNGLSDNGGHAFICDGYDDTGLFHINWGWGGQCDGYYSLSVLNPDQSSNVAYGSSRIGFTLAQEALIYLSPDLKEQPQPEGSEIDYFQYTNIEATGGSITYGTGRLDEPNDITVSISNRTPNDLTCKLQFKALYYGGMKEADITDNTSYLSFDTCSNNAFIRAWQDGEVTFRLYPKHKGLTRIKVYTEYDIFIGDFYLELANDTLINYSRYIENRSSYAIEDGKCSYNIELCDTTSNGVPDYVTPSDSIIYRIRCLYNDKKVMDIIVKDEIREYLKALSANGENSDSIFTYKADIDISKPGFYYLQSYLCDYVNGEYQSISCNHSCHFRISEPTNVKPAQTDAEPVIYYDILGRPVSGIPTQSGIYITSDHKKIIIGDK